MENSPGNFSLEYVESKAEQYRILAQLLDKIRENNTSNRSVTGAQNVIVKNKQQQYPGLHQFY